MKYIVISFISLLIIFLIEIIRMSIIYIRDTGLNITSDKILIIYDKNYRGFKVKYIFFKLFGIIPLYRNWICLSYKNKIVTRYFHSEQEAKLKAAKNRENYIKNLEL